MTTIQHILLFQGYGGYIWLSVFVTLGILLGYAWHITRELREVQHQNSSEPLV